MGKSLIIKGANFSTNGIAPTFRRLSWIGGSTKNGLDQSTPSGQYINSGVQSTINTKIIVEFTLDSTAHSVWICGGNTNNVSSICFWAQSSSTVFYMSVVNGQSSTNSLTISQSLWDGNKHVVEISKEKVVLDGITHNFATASSYSGSTTGEIYLDCVAQSSANNYNSRAYDSTQEVALTNAVKIHNVKVYTDYQDESSLAVDAIPVKRIADDVVCFYNAVNGEYLERNNGSTPEYE